MLSEISQSQKDKYCYDSTHMKNRKQTHINRKQSGGCQGLGGRGIKTCCLMSIEFLFCKMKKFWSSSHNNANILNTTELYT